MKVVFRADAGQSSGVGHIMRSLTLAQEILNRGHNVCFVSNVSEVDWITELITELGFPIVTCEKADIALKQIVSEIPDVVIVDSYEINSNSISELNSILPVVAIIDGDTRDIECTLFLDQNLGATGEKYLKNATFALAGSKYSLIRDDILKQKRNTPWKFHNEIPEILIFAGGTDAAGVIPIIYEALNKIELPISLTVVTNDFKLIESQQMLHHTKILNPSPAIVDSMKNSDLVITAAGTSAWEVCTLGIPSLFISVVDNQKQIVESIEKFGCGSTLIFQENTELFQNQLVESVVKLLGSEDFRETLSKNCLSHFDGRGKERVADWIENISTYGK